MFQHLIREPQFEIRHQLLRLTSAYDDPGRAAEDMTERLLAISLRDWTDVFGWHPP